MIVPDQEPYSPKDYLKDAARAQKEYWVDQKRSYFPEYHGAKVSKWEEVRPIVWFLCLALFAIAICAVIAYSPHHIQIIQPVHPKTFPTFSPNATVPVPAGYTPQTYPPISP